MGGRSTVPASSSASSSTSAYQTSGTGSSTNLGRSRTHSTNSSHGDQQHITHRRNRSSNGYHNAHGLLDGTAAGSNSRHRTESTNLDPSTAAPFNANILRYLITLDHESDDLNSDNIPPQARRHLQRFLFSLRDVSCPVCNKIVPSDSFKKHILQCLSKPRIDYNEDVLTENKGECVICLDDLQEGQKIARLPCLCIYHKSCIDNWFRINRSCPEHPVD